MFRKVITITFKIHQHDEEIKVICDKNTAISEYRDKVLKDKKYKNYIFATENYTYIDENTLCKDIKDCVCLMPDSLLPIKINLYDEDDRKMQKTITFKLSSTVSDLKQKLKEKFKSKFTFDKIKIKIEDEMLKDDDYIFSHKKEGDLVVDVTGCKKISKENEKYYFQFPDGKICGFEFDSDTNFNDINDMKEFKEQDFSFFFEDSEINKKFKISEYEAKEEYTPIQLKINYFIKVKYEGSKADPQEDHHPFASDQKVSHILDEYAKVVPERRKMEYEGVEYNEDTQISEIKYKKGNPLNITILPAKYSFQFEDSRESFKLVLNDDMTVKKLIRKIQKEKEIQSDLEIYTGSKVYQIKHEEDETMSNFSESQKIIIKKVDPQYEIIFKDKKGYKRLDVDWTVKDLLSDKKYKTTDERKKVVVKHKDEILSEDTLLCELRPRNISIEILDPIYQFQLDGSDPVRISISDDTDYYYAIEMVKEKFDELKEIEEERIEFKLNGIDFGRTNFGPDIPQEKPINVIILDPEYTWTVKENEEDNGENEDFIFPTNYKIKDAVKAIEKKFNYKFSIKIFLKKPKNKFSQVMDDINIYKSFYNNFNLNVFVLKCPIRFTFTANGSNFTKEFPNNDKIGQISKNVRLNKNVLTFSESNADDFKLNNKLEFEYKGKKFKFSDTFDALNYQPYENETIKIYLSTKKEENCFIDNEDEKMHIVVDRIGEGATSITYKVFDISSEKTMCKKVLKYSDKITTKDLQNAVKEFEFLKTVDHPCICNAYGINIAEPIKTDRGEEVTTVALFLEFLDYDLSKCLEKKILNNSMKARIVVEIAHGMFYIHKLDCIHRDLKIENIMLNSVFKAKIVDFGYSHINESLFTGETFSKKSLSKGVGTYDYMSPEMVNEEDYDSKTDVYSFGIVLYFMFIGSRPDYKMKDKMLGKSIKLPEPSKSFSRFCLDLIAKCTRANPHDRPSFDEILTDLRTNSYNLADGVDVKFVEKRDHELQNFK